jgi:hypothetical protein
MMPRTINLRRTHTTRLHSTYSCKNTYKRADIDVIDACIIVVMTAIVVAAWRSAALGNIIRRFVK